MQLLEWPYRLVLIASASALLVWVLGRLGCSTPARHGWRRLRPSPMHWTGLILGGGLVLLFLYVRLFVGSSRPDAEYQMNILTGLIVAFSVGVAVCVWTMLRLRSLAFEWRGTSLSWRDRRGERVVRSIDELSTVRRSALGLIILSFADGSTVKLDEHARGTGELLERIAEQRSDILPPSA